MSWNKGNNRNNMHGVKIKFRWWIPVLDTPKITDNSWHTTCY